MNIFNLLKYFQALFYFYEGEEDGGGTGDELDKGDGDDKVAQLEATLNGMVQIVQTLAQGQTGLQSTVTQLTEAIKLGQTKPEPEDEEFDMSDNDLETMSRADLIKLINTNTEKLLTKQFEKVSQNVDSLGNRLDQTISAHTVNEFAKEHKDLLEWKTEIGDLLKSGRTNNVPDAYSLVRTNNPDKAAKMDAKYNPKDKSDDSKVKLIGFQGFPPNSGSGGGENKRMTPKVAADAAWDEAISAMPGIEQYLTNDSTATH